MPSCLLEPIWGEFAALLGERPEFDPAHPLGCHRRRIPDRVVFEHVVAALVHGSGYERMASAGCSDRTIRRRLKAWAAAGIGQQVHALALRAFDQMIGLQLGDIAVDACITKAPCGGQRAGPSPVDRRKGGPKRSVATEDNGIPLGITCAGAHATIRHCWPRPCRPPRLNWAACCPASAPAVWTPGMTAGPPARPWLAWASAARSPAGAPPRPLQAGRRWPVERTHAWMNGYGKLRRMTDRDATIAGFCLYLAAAFVTIRQLIQPARHRYRWDTRPTTKRLK